jgi:hypothetical protein
MPSAAAARPVHSAYLRADGSLFARKPTSLGRTPGTSETSRRIFTRSSSATTDVSIFVTFGMAAREGRGRTTATDATNERRANRNAAARATAL